MGYLNLENKMGSSHWQELTAKQAISQSKHLVILSWPYSIYLANLVKIKFVDRNFCDKNAWKRRMVST